MKPRHLTVTIDIRHITFLALAAGMSVVACSHSPTAHGAELHECALHQTKVKSPVKEDASMACEGADRAARFLQSLGMVIPPGIAIEIVDDMPAAVDPSALGAYIKEEQRILVLGYRVVEKRREWYRLPVDREVYRGIVSHEVTHAVSAQNFRIKEPSILAEEYIAYVTLLSTMAPAQRRQIINLYHDDATRSDAGLHDVTVYMIDPVRFGVNAYRHFIRQENGRRFVQSILEGEAMTGSGDGS